MGFEPMEEFDPFTHFPGELLRPLRHLSAQTACRVADGADYILLRLSCQNVRSARCAAHEPQIHDKAQNVSFSVRNDISPIMSLVQLIIFVIEEMVPCSVPAADVFCMKYLVVPPSSGMRGGIRGMPSLAASELNEGA